jgi:two-component system response regulator DevR
VNHVTSDATSAIRVFLLDDHEIVRQGIAALLDTQPDIQVVGEAGTAAEALVRVPPLRPDVAVLDVRLPDGDGVTVCRELREQLPDMACLMLTSYADDEALFQSVMAGAAGYVIKEVRGGDLVQAIRTVAAGGSLLDATATSQLLTRLRRSSADPTPDPLRELTDQERRVLELIGQGMTNREIGNELFLAEKTVKNYVSSLLAKLGMQRRTQVAVLATELRERDHRRP